MSKRLAGVVLCIAVVLLTFALSFWYLGRDKGTAPEEQRGTELVEMAPTETSPDQVAVSGDSPEGELEGSAAAGNSEYEFVLVDNNNYVAVYQLPENLIYEYTDIIMDVLPEELRAEIREGKFLENEIELYNFLENYTS